MAWSYRCDRADEVYNTTGGPAQVEGEQIQRPPGDGEGEVKPPEEPGPQKEKEEVKIPAGLPGVTKADLRVLEAQQQDPEAGRPVESPSERLARESKLVNQTQDLEKSRLQGEERNRMRMEERTRIQGEELEKEREKMRKEAAEDVKKEMADEKKKAEDDKKKEESENKKQPAPAHKSPGAK